MGAAAAVRGSSRCFLALLYIARGESRDEVCDVACVLSSPESFAVFEILVDLDSRRLTFLLQRSGSDFC